MSMLRLTQQICRPCRAGCLNEASSCFRTGPGKSKVETVRDVSRNINSRFSNNVKNAFDICWKGWQYFETNDYPDGQLDWDDKIGEITSVALYQAALVTVRVRNWGDPSSSTARKLEQRLIHLLTQNNISVSLIAAKTQTIGRAVVLPSWAATSNM